MRTVVNATRTHAFTGIIGNAHLHAVLDAAGAHDTALALLSQTSYPSFGYEFANSLEKATTNLWELPDAPHETLLVLDGTTGQNAIRQASEFAKAAPVSGLILAKMDGTAKGGALFGIRDVLPVPVQFLGVGEGIDDLERFVAQDYVDAILQFEEPTEA